MKKMFCLVMVVVFAMMLVGCSDKNMNSIAPVEKTKEVELTDEALVKAYVDYEYGDDYYGIYLAEYSDDEYIDLLVYDSDSHLKYYVGVDRSYIDYILNK